MSRDKNFWSPTKNQRTFAEKYIWPLVLLSKLITTWYVVMFWSFIFPYILGQGILSCLFISCFATCLSWYLWKEPLEDDNEL